LKTEKVIGTLLIKVLAAFTAYRVTGYVIKMTRDVFLIENEANGFSAMLL